MSDKSAIEWTDATWNPTRGCTKIAPGCKNCYAERFAERFRGVSGHAYERGFDPRTVPDQLDVPLHWNRSRRIFVNSMSDLFHESFDDHYIAAVFGVMARAWWHTYQVLTKRIERARSFLATVTLRYCVAAARDYGIEIGWPVIMSSGRGRPPREIGWPLPNVWIGTSVSTQADADKNLPTLLRVPAAIRFVSIEPLLESVSIEPWLPSIGWSHMGRISGGYVRRMRLMCVLLVILVIVLIAGAWPRKSRRTANLIDRPATSASAGAAPEGAVWVTELDGVPFTAEHPLFIAGEMYTSDCWQLLRIDGSTGPIDRGLAWYVLQGTDGNIHRTYWDEDVPRDRGMRVLPVRRGRSVRVAVKLPSGECVYPATCFPVDGARIPVVGGQ